jgi:hypothetical protein
VKIIAWQSFSNYNKQIYGDKSKEQLEHHQEYILAICWIEDESTHAQQLEHPLVGSTGARP